MSPTVSISSEKRKMLPSQVRMIVYCAVTCSVLVGCLQKPSPIAIESTNVAANPDSQPSPAQAEWRELKPLAGCADGIKSLAFLHGGDQLVAGSFDGSLKIWEVSTGRELRTVNAHPNGRFGRFAVSPVGDCLATVDMERNIKLWDTKEWECVGTATGSSALYCATFSADGARLATSGEWKIDLWDCASQTTLP
jgi:WD40 repeat protein